MAETMATGANDFRLEGDTLYLRGNLTLATVTSVYNRSLSLASLPELPDIIDLEAVSKVDSAGLALLLEWQSWALKHDHQFCYCNVPDKLLKLASLCGATLVLNMVCCNDTPDEKR